MAWNSFNLKPICFIILVSFFNLLATTKAQDPFLFCSTDRTTASSAFQSNLNTLFSSLTSAATTANNNGFFNDTFSGTNRNPSDSVYGLFMCRGDMPSQLCGQCVGNATRKLSSDSDSGCSSSKQAVIWYDECMVRYSNTSFFSTVETSPTVSVSSLANISNPASFMPLLLTAMNQTADEAANSLNRYATNETNVTGSLQTLYGLAQCTRDLSPQDCRSCLARAIENLPTCCEGKTGAMVLFPSCNIRYELYPFYRVSTLFAGGLVPETEYTKKDSEYSEDPGYLSHNCTNSNDDFATTNSTALFYLNLGLLLTNLASNATDGQISFNMQNSSGIVYGLFLCRDDIPPHLCGDCVQNATIELANECRSSRQAVIWYNHCFVRYSNQSFFSTMDTSPRSVMLNITNTSEVNGQYTYALSNALAEMANRTGDSVGRYQTESLKLNEDQTVYILAQCTPDLSSRHCGGCLIDVIGSAIPWSHLGSVGGRVLYPSCNLRFELFPFYNLLDAAPAPPSPSTGTTKDRSRTIILVVVSIAVSVILFSFGYYLIRRKVRNKDKTILRENFGQEGTTLEALQFDLSIIKEATNNFSHQNKIGKGGFGEVYKGILIDGRHIAVKRLSRTSKQGAKEFRNEVLLIAKLQHKNLVALLGFCLEEQEKILIYEYVQNKSLNYFLFDTQQQKLLSWLERHKIIEEIARGILYLHEHSRLKIIHRDLKPSNILLDENMNPKISDFGLARIVEIDQDETNTNRIVGTYGYMSPEYAMFGQFSDKSDVFSFGVMILEIITGKKNAGSYEYSSRVADGLLSYVWKQWRDQTPLNILDPKLKENYSKVEVIKCIQIGLLCVQENPDARPTMVTLVSYLSSHSIELPSPEKPAFFLQGRMDQHIIGFESSSSQSANGSIPVLSSNRMSISEFHPR